ncbi:MAG TPA: HNH endonuclease signature motif containing protein [Thauera aminoaromatica]|nr:HNH endonuclease signature motif containing protein [Thauera aminoaromatica]
MFRPAGARTEAERQAESERYRATRTERGYSNAWLRYSKRRLAEHPLCERCQAEGRYVAATVTDHKLPHRGNGGLFWDPDNHQALCKCCHDSKTAREDGGFGNRARRVGRVAK